MLPGKKLTPADLLKMARRRSWLIVIPPLVTFFVALLYSSTIQDLYEADMLIAIDPQRVPDSFVRSTVTLETDRRVDALTVQVLSRTALEQTIETFDLYPVERRRQQLTDVVEKMRGHVKVEMETPRPKWGQPPQPTAFHVRFTYPDPAIAAKVTQQLGGLFVEQNVRDRNALAGATNRFLEGQLASARQKLEQQERKLEAFRQRHGQELPTQMQSNMQALANAQIRAQNLVESIARDRDRKQMLERLYREASNEPTTVTQAAGSTAAAPMTVQQQLDAARANLSSLEARYKPDHPDLVRARRLVADLEPRAAAEAAKAAEASRNAAPAATTTVADPVRRESLRQMRAEIESLDRQAAFKDTEEQRVRQEIGEYQRRLEAVPGLESEWVKLTRDYDTLQTSYRELLTKSKAAEMAANLEDQDIGERFRIVDPAIVPVEPLPAVRIRINAAGMFVGLLLGVGIAGLLELRDASFRNEADVLDVLALPVLASIPRVETQDERTGRRRRQLALSMAGVASLMVAGYLTWTLKLWHSLI